MTKNTKFTLPPELEGKQSFLCVLYSLRFLLFEHFADIGSFLTFFFCKQTAKSLLAGGTVSSMVSSRIYS